MTRLDEALKATAAGLPHIQAAERSVGIGRVVRRKRWRAAATGAGIVGAIAVVTAGVIEALPAAAPQPSPSGSLVSDSQFDAQPSALSTVDAWWGTCRSHPLTRYPPGNTDEFSLTVTASVDDPLDASSPLAPTATLAALTDTELLSSGPDWAILYDGMVVALVQNTDVQQLTTYVAGDVQPYNSVFTLTRCDVDSPLPPGSYQLVASMLYSESSGTPLGEASPRVTSDPLDFTIAGTPPDDPFGYEVTLDSEGPTLAYPSDAMDPFVFAQLLADSPAEGAWDMAEGTSRWLSSGSLNDSADQYYGCSQDGGPAPLFPTSSSTADLIVDEWDLPDALRLRYGWIVIDPTEFAVRTTNTSAYPFSGFYTRANRSFDYGYGSYRSTYLVSEGRVVAYVSLGSSHPYSAGSPPWAQSDVNTVLTADEYYGVLDPGGSVSDLAVITQIGPCWTAAGPGRTIRPGTYTVVSEMTVSVGSPLESSLTQAHLWTSFGTIDITYE